MSLSFRDSNGILHEIASKSLTDSFLSNSSENPVKNKTIYYALENKVEKATQDLVHYYLKSETYSKEEVNSLIGSISSLDLAVVATLPTQDISTTTIYLVGPDSETGKYDEYVYFNNSWVQIGDTSIDLSGYVTSSELTAAIADFLTETEIRSLVQTCYTKIETNALLDAKQDVLTFDNAPIENSTNPVKSGGVYTALSGKQDTLTYDNLPTENSTNMVKSGGIYTAINSLGADDIAYDNTNSELVATDVQDAVDEIVEDVENLNESINGKVDWESFSKLGSINVCPICVGTTTLNGVKFTVNSDGTITATGTATEFTPFDIATTDMGYVIEDGEYILSDGLAEHSSNQYSTVTIIDQNDEVHYDYANTKDSGKNVFSIDNSNIKKLYVSICIGNDYTVSNLVFKPMIRPSSVTPNTFVPYSETNKQLTNDKVDWKTVGYLGAKNLNSYPYYQADSVTSNDVTFTVQSDGSVLVNGTASADTTYIFHTRASELNSLILPNGRYIISGCPSTGSSSTYRINANRTVSGSGVVYGSDIGKGLEVTLNGDDYSNDRVRLGLYIYINNGTTLDNIVFKPMIRLASDKDETYQPYSMTNQDITSYVQSISNPNLLDNPWFTINQRGQTTYTAPIGSSYMTVDRWHKFGGTVVVSSDGVTLSTTTSDTDGNFYSEYLLSEYRHFLGSKVTLSIKINNKIYSATGRVPSSTASYWQTPIRFYPLSGIGLLVALHISPTSSSRFQVSILVPKDGNEYTIQAIKLEMGDISTLGLDTSPNYAQELDKCKRYFEKNSWFSWTPEKALANGYIFRGFSYRYDVQKRAQPSFTFISGNANGQLIDLTTNTTLANADITISNSGAWNPRMVQLKVEHASIVSGHEYFFAVGDNVFSISADI